MSWLLLFALAVVLFDRLYLRLTAVSDREARWWWYAQRGRK